MMDNLENALKILFKRVSISEILQNKIEPGNIKENSFIQIMRSYSNQYSDTELRNLYYYLVRNFATRFYAADMSILDSLKTRDNMDVFQLLRYYAKWILTIQDNEILCEYSKFLHWRSVSLELSEDLFITCYLAQREYGIREERKSFDWKINITHNNRELKRILSQGMAENHSHLKGAAPIFPLTWISLMNQPQDEIYNNRLNEIDSMRRSVNYSYHYFHEEPSLMHMVYQAAYIRLLLFYMVIGYQNPNKNHTKVDLLDWYDSYPMRDQIVTEINTMRLRLDENRFPDYALLGLKREAISKDKKTQVFQGERWLMYQMFLGIFGGKKIYLQNEHLFYAYLVIKENIRSEIVQTNDSIGFENFKIYQDRKEYFLESDFYNYELVKCAVQNSLFNSGGVVTMEARFAPRNSAQEYKKYIEKMDSCIDAEKKLRSRFFYVVHFVKTEETLWMKQGMIECRHWKKREECKKQAIALKEFREIYPLEAIRIRGIDAANMEIGCGPEIFAQTFRYLASHIVEYKIQNLQIYLRQEIICLLIWISHCVYTIILSITLRVIAYLIEAPKYLNCVLLIM